jgi:hypothetical protein
VTQKNLNKFPFSLRVETFYNEILCCTDFLSFHTNLLAIMSEGLVLKFRCGCMSNTKVKGFRELHKFNARTDAKALVAKAIPNSSWRPCRHCTRNGKMKGFHTHNNMLAHHITELLDHATQVNLYNRFGLKHLVVADCSLMGGRFPPGVYHHLS